MPTKPITPTDALKRRAAIVAASGNVTLAAKKLGLPRETLASWLRAHPAEEDEASPRPANVSELETDLEKLEEENETLLTELKFARNVVVREPIRVSAKKHNGKDDWIRVVIPDSHGEHISRPAAAAFLQDLKSLAPDEIVMLGDHLDCGGFLAQHHAMGFVAETETSYAGDVRATNDFLNEIQKASPSARMHYLQGNHELRVERWCVTQALRNTKDSQFLLDVFGPIAVLGLKERGISYYRSSERYHNLPIPGTIQLGTCTFTHGISCGTHATHDHATRFGISVVHGHTHRSQSSIIRTVGGGVIGAWSPGCLAQLQPLYQATSPTSWSHGYGLQVVSRSGKFLHLNVPIIDGESLLNGLRTQP